MNKLFLLILTLVPFLSRTQNLLFEDFNYPAKDSLENCGNWLKTGVDSKFNIKVASPGLEYLSYSGSGVGNCAEFSNDGNGDVLFHRLKSKISTGSIYISFLLRVDSLSDKFTQGSIISLNPGPSTNLNTKLTVKKLSSTTFSLGVTKFYSPIFTNDVYSIDKSYLVVLKYEFINGVENDISSLYVFKFDTPSNEPSMALAQSSLGPDQDFHGEIILSNNYAENGLHGCDIKLDGIRVGTSWETSVLAIPTSVSNVNQPAIECNIFPNPTSDILNIDLNLEQSSYVNISILNPIGSVVETVLNSNKYSGNHSLKLNTSAIPSGTYFINIQINDRKIVRPFQIIGN